jgi:hypothetical protein
MTSQVVPPTVSVQGRSDLLYYSAAVILCGPWLLVLDHYSEGGKNLFGSRLMLSLTVGVTMILAARCLRPIVGRPKGAGHVGGAIILLLLFLLAFAVSLLVLAVASHVISDTPWGDGKMGPALSLLGSLFFVLYTAAAFTVMRWYAVLPLLAVSYALLTWAGTRRSK